MLLALSFAKPQQHSCEGIYTRASILLPRRNAWYHYREKQGKKRKEGKVWSEREAKEEGLQVSSLRSASCTRRFLDYAAIRNFRGSSDSGENHPRNWCCLATRSLRATRASARYFSPALSPFRHSNKTLREHIYYSCPWPLQHTLLVMAS